MSAAERSSAWPGRAAVIGGGTMGIAIAQVLVLNGARAALVDIDAEAAEKALARAAELGVRFVRDGLIGESEWEGALGRLEASDLEPAVAGSDLVIEAVTEDPGVKERVLAAVEGAAGPETVIATNTSAIPIRNLAAGLADPSRFLGVHWFNPAQWVPGVEVIPGERTRDEVTERVLRWLGSCGKRAVVVGDRAGFVGNRLQFAIFREAAQIVAEGVASATDVDEVIRGTFGFRLPFHGSFEVADLAGLDVYAGAYEALAEDLGPRFSAPETLLESVRRGDLGSKTGRGFLDWPAERSESVQSGRDRNLARLAELVDPDREAEDR